MKGINPRAVAIEKINQFFASFKFNITDFCNDLKLSSDESEKFLSYLLQCIYYHEIIEASCNSYNGKSLKCLLLTLLAESIDEESLKKILISLSDDDRLQLLCQCSTHMREGAWIVLNSFIDIFEPESLWMELLNFLKNQYFDAKDFNRILTLDGNLSLAQVFKFLSEKAELQVREIINILPRLIELMITSSIRGFDLIEIMKQQESDYIPTKQDIDLRKQAIASSQAWRERFNKSLDADYLENDVINFFKFYGLNGYFLPPVNQEISASLIDLLKELLKRFENPLTMDPSDIPNHLLFVLKITERLKAFHKTPEKIVQGFKNIIYTLSTRGHYFSKLPWLPSISSAFGKLKKHLESKALLLPKFPIIVFDQAKPFQFEENRKFIETLSKKYQLDFWHLSRKEILQLAHKLKITKWILTDTKDGDEIFGFGGARNCQLLLAPVIHGAVQNGTKNFQELISLDEHALFNLFETKVLKGETFIHLGEDDVVVLPCHIFSGLIWVEEFKDYYCMKSGLAIGRNTSYVTPFVDAISVLKDPSRLFAKWSEQPFSAGMKEQITKPKFSMPLPFGNEELHVQTLSTDYDFFLPPVLHLASARFPEIKLPKSPLDGLEDHLKVFLPYSMQISLVISLIDVENKTLRNILPWNDSHAISSCQIRSLKDLLGFVFKKANTLELKRRFWQNFYDLFNDLNNSHLPIGTDILRLSCFNLNDHEFSLSSLPKPLIDYYTFVKEDALFFLEFGVKVMEYRKEGIKDFVEKAIAQEENRLEKKISTLPLSDSLKILIQFIESFEELNFLKQRESK